MVSVDQIQNLADDIVRRFAPERVILFGSYAYGLPTADSDVDFLVVLPPFDEPSAKKSSQMRQAVHAGFPLDVLAYSSDVLKKRLAMNDYFLREVVERGKTLYDATER